MYYRIETIVYVRLIHHLRVMLTVSDSSLYTSVVGGQSSSPANKLSNVSATVN